jgi:hypothetical protein
LEGISLRPGNLFEFAFRLMDIVTNELINNDLVRFERVNDWVRDYEQVQAGLGEMMADTKEGSDARAKVDGLLSKLPSSGWRHIPLTVIRPQNEIVLDLLHFTREDIQEAIKQGRQTADRLLASPS